MRLTRISRVEIINSLGALKVLGGVVLLWAASWEIIHGDHIHFSAGYLRIQFVVCVLLLADLFIRWAAAPERGRFFLRNVLYLLISIPYLNIIDWSGVTPSRDWALLMGMMPLVRAFLASYIVVLWLVNKRIQKLALAYVFTVLLFTYLSALVFYDCEVLVNDKLHGFGNALWWAWMNVTTVGAEIFAVTTIGKLFTVLLPTLGMMMFPIFTSYILDQYGARKKKPDA